MKATAEALEITFSAVSQWKETIPQSAAARIELLTQGKLRVNPLDYPYPRRQNGLSADVPELPCHQERPPKCLSGRGEVKNATIGTERHYLSCA